MCGGGWNAQEHYFPYCWEKLVTIDIDLLETKNLARFFAVLACEKELVANFVSFQL